MTREFIDFVGSHRHDDTARLMLDAARYPAIDMRAAAEQIEGLRTAATKWPSLAGCPGFQYPPRLNREQASSEATASLKAAIAARLLAGAAHPRIADLTGGMGIDSMALARTSGGAAQVDYIERDPGLCDLARANCAALGLDNIRCHCADSLQWLRQQADTLDLLYIDPARRDPNGRRVAAFEDSSPDILHCLPLLAASSRWLMVKASPMIDIDLALRQLGTACEVHTVSVRGECKEVLFVVGPTAAEPLIHVHILADRGEETLAFSRDDEAAAQPTYAEAVGRYLYEPDAALMKAGCFRLLCSRWGAAKLSPNTHLYTSDELLPAAVRTARTFEVLRTVGLGRKAVRQALPEGRANVIVRNYPVRAAALQQQLGLRDGGDLCLVATTLGTRRLGLLCRLLP